MLNPFDTWIRRLAAVAGGAVLAALVIVPAAASKPIPGPNRPSVQDIRTQGNNWAAKARLLDLNGGIREVLPSAQDIQTQSDNWAAKARLLDVNGGVQTIRPSAQDIRTQGKNWAAKGRLLDANGGLLTTQEAVESDTGGFDASDFGIGAGVALAFVLLLGAVAVGFNVVHVGTRRERAT